MVEYQCQSLHRAIHIEEEGVEGWPRHGPERRRQLLRRGHLCGLPFVILCSASIVVRGHLLALVLILLVCLPCFEIAAHIFTERCRREVLGGRWRALDTANIAVRKGQDGRRKNISYHRDYKLLSRLRPIKFDIHLVEISPQ